MNSQFDHFAASFNSIRLDDKTPPVLPEAPLAFGEYHAESAPAPETETPAQRPFQLTGEAPGFYLLDDANGRFTIDRDTGIVSLQHDNLLTLEAGAIHPVHIRCVEFSGNSYELKFRLRMTGRVPQIAGAEENDMLAGIAAAPLLDLMTPEEKVVAPEPPPIGWLEFTAFTAGRGKAPLYGETARFGTLLTPTYPAVYLEASTLVLGAALPAPSSIVAEWGL